MAKSKKFIVERSYGSDDILLYGLNGIYLVSLCYYSFHRLFGIKLKCDERKKVEITIKEVK